MKIINTFSDFAYQNDISHINDIIKYDEACNFHCLTLTAIPSHKSDLPTSVVGCCFLNLLIDLTTSFVESR